MLDEIGVSETTPRFEAWNKVDLLDPERHQAALADASRRDDVVAIAALTGEGVSTLVEEVAAKLTVGHRRYVLALDASDGAGAAWLHAHGEVLGQVTEGLRTSFEVRLSQNDYERFVQRG